MRQVLKLHPESRCAAVTHIEADVARPRPGSLVLRYDVAGRISDLRLPPASAGTRADKLWRHTCFEAFVRAPGEAYYEFNFAPSTQWAAYWFGGYRGEMSIANEISAPRVDVRSSGADFELQVTLDLPNDAAGRICLAAVIEEADGRLSYWALAHPPGKPDFHHSDCFALELPAVVRL
jgi:hypothetical protein